MTEQEQLIQEIRQRLGNTPKAGMIDSLAYATRLSQDYSISVDEIRKIVVKEADAAPLFKRVSAPAPRRKSTLSR
jgi:hydroxyacyl-ACP dehydratase HTD2-like protein with hotdog domain